MNTRMVFGWVLFPRGDLLRICESRGMRWYPLGKQTSELASKLFSKLETLRFYSLPSLPSIQSSKSVNPSAMN